MNKELKDSPLLVEIQDDLERLHGIASEPSHFVRDFLVVSDNTNALVVREEGEYADAALLLKRDLLERIAEWKMPNDFSFERLPDLSIVIEELSHFNLFCQRAIEERALSALEAEVQGEVDKFALSLEWLHRRNESEFEGQLFDTLFGSCNLGSWVSSTERERYQDAHSIARNFCRSLLDQPLSYEERRGVFRDFFYRPAPDKLSSKI